MCKEKQRNKIKARDLAMERSLKIQTRYRSSRWRESTVPVLTLCGKWLEELGFEKGSRVVVCTSSKQIIIRPEW